MARGDVRRAGRKRKLPVRENIAKRIGHCCLPQAPEGVQPLAQGFFMLEQMRNDNVAAKKSRKTKRGKIKGK